MAIRPIVIAVICVGLFLMFETLILPKAMALKTNGFRMEDLRTHKRRNYILQGARDKEIKKSLQERGYDMDIEPSDAVRAIRDQLADTADYAGTIDADGYIDNSVETRVAKRDNTNLAIMDTPCTCSSVRSFVYLGDNVFPRRLSNTACNSNGDTSVFAHSYKCQEIFYPVPILKKKCPNSSLSLEASLALIPNHLSTNWCADVIQVPVGCQCEKTYKV